ncbi:MAG: HEAT repeat domain-containing protein [Acidobacteria bacterium]|nr:HEAT repeat domain-containing protein [Acidobacteriota bacterium]
MKTTMKAMLGKGVLAAAAATATLSAQDAQFAFSPQQADEIRAKARAAAEAVRANVDAMKIREMYAYRGREDDQYRRAARLVDERKYEEALQFYNRIIEQKGARIEGAMYWKAYTQAKLGQRDAALATLDELKKGYAQSRWMNDAKALELEIRQRGGRAASPEAVEDEELKLLAINGLLSTDPERAIPLLEKQLNNPANSPRLKDRALFVLAQSRNQKARDIVARYAAGGSNPDQQALAIQYLGSFGKENRDKLMEIYRASNEPQIKRAVLRGLQMSRDSEYLLQIARSEQNPELQREAIRYAANAGADVSTMWNASLAKETKDAILEGLMSRQNVDKLVEIAKTDSDPQVRRRAIEYLGGVQRERGGTILQQLYSSEQDKKVRASILHSLRGQENVKALIEVARKESDPQLKREAVQMLSSMKNPEATEFLVELLNK